jgi:hypothetical protein
MEKAIMKTTEQRESNNREALKTLISCPNCCNCKPCGDHFFCWRVDGILEEVSSNIRCERFQFNDRLKPLWERAINNNF